MAELKTKATQASVTKYLDAIKDEQRRRDCRTIAELMQKATGAEPKMWGTGIVGFGDCHYVYESGREGEWFLMGLSPRKQNLTLYSMGGFTQFDALLKQLGKHKLMNQEGENQNRKWGSWSRMGAGIAIGVGIGAALGVAMGNMGAGVAIGIAIGAGMGTVFSGQQHKKKE